MNELLQKELEARGLPLCRESLEILSKDPRNTGSRNDLLDANFQRAIADGRVELERLRTNPTIDPTNAGAQPVSGVGGRDWATKYMEEHYSIYMDHTHPKHEEIHAEVKRRFEYADKIGKVNEEKDNAESARVKALVREATAARKKTGILDI